jgi:predicted ribosome quality control (RQC) complex YloA/Tae2 family protein
VPHFLLKQFEGQNFLEYDSFENCCDEYFSQASKQKEVSKNQSKESAIWSKMNKIKEDQEKRISGLQKEQDMSEFKAILLQKYIFEVQAIIDILQVMTNSGISWAEIKR